jgi:hypothetical protein
MGDFFGYLSVFLSQWWWFLTSGPYVLDPLLESMSDSYHWWKVRHLPLTAWRRLKIALALLGIFFAGFFAWRDEHMKVAQQQTEINRLSSLGGEEAKAQIDSLTQANDGQRKRLTDALSEVEKLTAQVNEVKAQNAPRRIKDLKHFISVLSLFRGQIVDVEHIAMNQEAENFIGLLETVVEVSGWTIGDAGAMGGQTWNGVIIEVNDLREAMPAAYELKNLLAQQGTAVVIRPRSGRLKPGRFTIRVGYKIPGRMANQAIEHNK